MVAKGAGSFIRQQLREFESGDVIIKDFNSLVSYVDIEAEKKIVAGLHRLLPEAGFVTEEDTHAHPGDEDYVWIIDPLDGTTNFIHALPFFGVSIAMKCKEEIVLGVVYDVMHDILFEASIGGGARANDQQLSVSTRSQLSDAVLATGFPYNSFGQMEQYLNLFRVLFQETRGIRRFGSAALDLCYVANGSFGGFFEYGLNIWDIAAGICIVKEAGGTVTDFNGGQEMEKQKTILATNGLLHPPMKQYIDQYF